MNETISIKIVVPANIILECFATIITMPGEEGVFGVLPNHAPLIASLKSGIIKITLSDDNKLKAETSSFKRSGDILCFISGGIAEVNAARVNVITEFAIDITNLSRIEILEKISTFQQQLLQEIDITKTSNIKTNISRYQSIIEFLPESRSENIS